MPVHIVGYSNGGALAVQYALDALEAAGARQPDRIVLLSPMIGVTAFARFAGVPAGPRSSPGSRSPPGSTSMPEFNPFKYNSFPVNAARQSSLLTPGCSRNNWLAPTKAGDRAAAADPHFPVGRRRHGQRGGAGEHLIRPLPANGSELVLFDVNRATPFDILLSQSAQRRLQQMLPTGAQRYRITVIGNAPGDARVLESARRPGASEIATRQLDFEYPRGFFSLSHVALPFPTSDSLYGTDPDDEDYGVHLGSQVPRAERGILINGADTLVRASCNPFFPYMQARIEETL